MVVGSVCLYLAVRKSSIMKFPTQLNNLAMFLVPLLIYLSIGALKQIDYSITLTNLVIIALTSLFFSYLANVTSLRSIELAPNPGYSLVISKSYVVFTTIIAYLFLGGEITVRKSIAIILIVIFSGLIAIDPSKTREVRSKLWLIYTMYSFFGWGFLSLIIKYLAVSGMTTLAILSYMYVFVSLFIVVEILYKKVVIRMDKVSMLYFGIIGVFSALFNYFNFFAVSIAPNVGYVNAINASSISLVTVLSIVLFSDEYSLRKILGVFGVSGGLLLLLI